MKKILAMAAVAALAAGASAYAANPFADVSTSDWAYQAVSDLSDQGIVEGYPDGTFKGETNITRYEMAQIIARLMAKEDQYNAEQRATIDKLAGEYADELDTLGVRVSNLEKKVGNISWSGDSRMRFIRTTDGNDAWQGRVRITAQGQVNEDTKVVGRFTSGNVDFKNDAGNSNDGDVSMDRMYVQHQFGDKVGLTLGRYEVDMGTQACWLYGNAFDGAEAQINFNDDYSLKFGFGRFKDAKGALQAMSSAMQKRSTRRQKRTSASRNWALTISAPLTSKSGAKLTKPPRRNPLMSLVRTSSYR